jgi:hypothetical protein
MLFKRNQVESAIGRMFEPGSAKPSSELRARMKRLLETDRGFDRNKRSGNPVEANFAFYSDDAPGRGVENWFSGYEAFALLTGLRLMRHGWPQGFAVSILRDVRPVLERQYERMIQQDPEILFDQEQIRQMAEPGALVVANTDPVFLAIISRDTHDPTQPVKAAVYRGQQELMQVMRADGVTGQAWSTFELVNSAHRLLRELVKTKPRKRGRGSR